MCTRLTLAALVAAASATLVAQSSPTSPTPDEQRQPRFRAEANYVRVDMYPTVGGRPVADLKPEEIEILEDGAPQKIVTFEYIAVRPPGAQETRTEPSTVAESRQLTADPRARVFVIFIDTHHVRFEGAVQARKPIAQFLERVIGQDDLVAVMTPEMSVDALAFGRKTTVISKMLDETWTWGRRERLLLEDPRERMYEACFPGTVAQEMVQRRREKLTFDGLRDLVVHLGGLREERKVVFTIAEGWRLFQPNRLLASARTDTPAQDPIYVGPDGKLRRGVDSRNTAETVSYAQCEADRIALAEWDARLTFHELFGRANRANVSFYTVDTRGLVPTDGPLLSGSGLPAPASSDGRSLRGRLDSLRALAENTDGLAIQDTNALGAAMQRVVSDLTSYYLVGYYSSNSKPDGKFREISIRVKRPGVQVRARRGYLAPTPDDLTNAAAAEQKETTPTPVSQAFEALAAVSPRSQFRIRAAAWNASADDRPSAAIWLVGEVDQRTRRDVAWSAGATADIAVTSGGGADVTSKSVALAAGQPMFTVRVPEAGALPPGEYTVRIRVRPTADASLPVSDTARVIVSSEGNRVGDAVIWRRGPTTGPKYVATADPRFQRSERIRLEHPTTAAGAATGRLLDRSGNAVNIPVQVSDRQDASGEFRWLVAEAALAPLAPGDYAIELTLNEARVVTAFKVVP